MIPTVLAFVPETVPDVAALRRRHQLSDALADEEVVDLALQRQRATEGRNVLPACLQIVRAVHCAMFGPDGLHIRQIRNDDEATCLSAFFAGIADDMQIVSSDASQHLAVLGTRALVQGVTAPSDLFGAARVDDLPGALATPATELDGLARLCGYVAPSSLDAAAQIALRDLFLALRLAARGGDRRWPVFAEALAARA